MGYLRIWLAFSVMAGHYSATDQLHCLLAPDAVACFFVLSGFLICMVLEEKYQGRLKKYYLSRALRIYPAYWIALLLTLAYAFFVWAWTGGLLLNVRDFSALPIKGFAASVLAFIQFSLFGMDAINVLGLNAQGSLCLSSSGAAPLSKFLFLPHAWSLGAELIFYLAAPKLCRAPSLFLAALAALSLAWGCGGFLGRHIWFPFQAGYFALGILAWRHRISSLPVLALGLLFFLALPSLLPVAWQGCAAVLALASGLGSLLAWSSKLPWDRVLGEISYGIFLIHPLALDIFKPYLSAGLLSLNLPERLALGALAGALLWMSAEFVLRRLRGRLMGKAGA